MHHRTRIIVTFLAFATVVAMAPAFVSGPSSAASPYLSALDGLGPSVANAAPAACDNKICTNAPRGLKFACAASAGTNCKVINGGKDCTRSTC